VAKGRQGKPKKGKKVTRDYLGNRNLAKPYRPMRTIIDKETGEAKFYELDNMKMGANGQRVNTTGCYGIKTTGRGTAGLSIVVKGKTGKPRYSRPKKNGGKDWNHVDWDNLIDRRRRIHIRFMWHGINPKVKLTDIERKTFARLTQKLQTEKPQLWEIVKKQDERRRRCVAGQIANWVNKHRKPGQPKVKA